jgi:hypothetical protein
MLFIVVHQSLNGNFHLWIPQIQVLVRFFEFYPVRQVVGKINRRTESRIPVSELTPIIRRSNARRVLETIR